ncbi:histone deacetylase complex subunit sap30l [Anaeramoeba flamelloides]|uniref:Histone deacetylase complex subunit sap30l n=1 Tax=Anaeramoeba flamelloides TaxID=1746091 RepID=A0AAV7Z3N5_9EUKA|nr:histone deacetylase complex subunit sap30l [Anaeramoeba flamelloides]KAJ6255224.1 histone deacetylase complex subunit sap30l [Anaeramoeba flamelloides]
MPTKRRTRSTRSTENIQNIKHNNRTVRNTTKRKTRSQSRKKTQTSIDFTQLRIETLLEIKEHYKITSKTKNRKTLASLILRKFTEQVINEKEIIREFLQITKDY